MGSGVLTKAQRLGGAQGQGQPLPADSDWRRVDRLAEAYTKLLRTNTQGYP